MKKKVLIVGNDANAYALAKKLSDNCDITVTPSSDCLKEFCETLDIREDKPDEILEYILENPVDLTVVTSKKAIESDIATLFGKNNQHIFAPTAGAADLSINKHHAKKTFYKLQIPTPKFGIFEKESMALDYIKKQKYPFVIKTNDSNSATIITSDKTANIIVNSVFIEKNKKIIIEDYIYGTPFSYYAITDGYKALPIGSSLIYRHSLDGNGGQLTGGMASCVPDYKLSVEDEYFLMDNVIYPILEHLEVSGSPYLGIFGIDGIKTDSGEIYILGCGNFPQNSDAAAIFENIDDDIYSIFESCVIGSFSDETESISVKDNYAVSLVLKSKYSNKQENSVSGLEDIDDSTLVTFFPSVTKNKYLEYEVSSSPAFVLTSFAPTVSSASERVYENADIVNFSGKFYRTDICKV